MLVAGGPCGKRHVSALLVWWVCQPHEACCYESSKQSRHRRSAYTPEVTGKGCCSEVGRAWATAHLSELCSEHTSRAAQARHMARRRTVVDQWRPWALLDKEQIEKSPSFELGMSFKAEKKIREAACKAIGEAGKLPKPWTRRACKLVAHGAPILSTLCSIGIGYSSSEGAPLSTQLSKAS